MIRKLSLNFGLIAVLAFSALTMGPALADIRIVVPTRDIARGEVIADSDLAFGTVTGTALMNGTVTSMDALSGMEARRVLRAGQAVSVTDVLRPILVTRGQTITMTFDAPGVNLTAMGRAMSEGGIGDTVTVQNPASFRMINAVVTAAGTVRATGPLSNGMPNQLTAQK